MIRPAEAVMTPTKAMVTRMPAANTAEMPNARLGLIFPCSPMNPTMSGMLDRWQGLKMMLSTPHTKDALSAMSAEPSTALVRLTHSCSRSFHPHLSKLCGYLVL